MEPGVEVGVEFPYQPLGNSIDHTMESDCLGKFVLKFFDSLEGGTMLCGPSQKAES